MKIFYYNFKIGKCSISEGTWQQFSSELSHTQQGWQQTCQLHMWWNQEKNATSKCCSEQPEVKMSSKAGEKPWVRRGCRASESRNLQQWFPSGREWPYSERKLWEQGHFEQSKITGDSGKSWKALEKKKPFKSGSIFLETKAVKKCGKQRSSPQPSSEIQRTGDFSRSPCQKSKTVATERSPRHRPHLSTLPPLLQGNNHYHKQWSHTSRPRILSIRTDLQV